MSVTSLKRKALRNRIKAKNRIAEIKRLSLKPTLKNIDVKAIWESFEEKGKKTASKKAEAAEEKTPAPKVQETDAVLKEEVKKTENTKISEPADSDADSTSESKSDIKKSDPVTKKKGKSN